MSYKESKYNIWIDHYPDENFSLVFNVLQRSLLKLPTQLVEKIRCDKICDIPVDILTILFELNILIEKEVDEMSVFRYWFERYRLQGEAISFTFLPTYSCNCKCIYCYEDGVRKDMSIREYASEEQIKCLLTFVNTVVKLSSARKLDFSFHGGEPLLYPEIIEKVGYGINQIAEDNGLEKIYSIVTNGTLLNDKVLSFLKKISIERILCTLDGVAAIHNSRRQFLTGNGTFELVFSNVKRALDKGFIIVLNVNLDRLNYHAMSLFLDFLVKEHLVDYKNFRLIFSIVKQGLNTCYPEYFKNYQFQNEEEEADILLNCYQEALQRNLRIVDPISGGFCTFRINNNFIIDYRGDIYKCISLTGNKEAYVGNIQEPLSSIYRRLSLYLYPIPWISNVDCQNCKFLPLCLGGCAQQALLKRGNQFKTMCMEKFLRKYIPGAVKIKHDYTILFPEELSDSLVNLKELLRL